ncbi:SpoVG family protein [bacterium]|nr:SpoVG family protein [bacterium]
MMEKILKMDRINLLENKGALKALAAVKISNLFVIKNLKVIEGKKGLFVAMPSEVYIDKTSQEKKYTDIVFPVNKESYNQLQQVVLDAYKQELNKSRN